LKSALTPIEMLLLRKAHVDRLANTHGAAGEGRSLAITANWIARPKGQAMKNLLAALAETGIVIAGTSFDLIELPVGASLDFHERDSITEWLPQMIFIEVKTANQSRVQPDFGGFFFALTEKEIQAYEALGKRHRVVLFNAATETMLRTSVAEILGRARSTTWQVSVQL
jgi:hypothetical protein